MSIREKLSAISEVVDTRSVSSSDPLALFKKKIFTSSDEIKKVLDKSFDVSMGMAIRRLNIGSDDPSMKEMLDDILYRIKVEAGSAEVTEKNRRVLEAAKNEINKLLLLLGALADSNLSHAKKFQSETKKYRKELYRLLQITK